MIVIERATVSAKELGSRSENGEETLSKFSRAFGSRFSRQSRENDDFAAKNHKRAKTIPPVKQATYEGACSREFERVGKSVI